MRYEKPTMQVEAFDTDDVITLSGGPSLTQQLASVLDRGEAMLNDAFSALQNFGSGS